MPEGQIVRAVSGFYYVRTPEGEQVQCRARGVFKKKNVTPLVGDLVRFDWTGDGQGFITEVKPRKTQLIRPPIANVEQAIVVCALREPAFQPMVVDRVLVHCEKAGLDVVLCLTKTDLVTEEEEIERIRSVYESVGYPVVATSVVKGEGIDTVRRYLKGALSVFAGQSGVGKSSLLNAIHPGFQLATGTVSSKIGRGRHTTRTVEILDLPDGGQVADTPGFSQLTFQGMEASQLSDCFPEFRLRSPECRFRGCLHRNEPDCAVRAAVEKGEVDAGRYEHYLQFLQEVESLRRY